MPPHVTGVVATILLASFGRGIRCFRRYDIAARSEMPNLAAKAASPTFSMYLWSSMDAIAAHFVATRKMLATRRAENAHAAMAGKRIRGARIVENWSLPALTAHLVLTRRHDAC